VKLKIIVIALIALLAITVAPTVVAANGPVQKTLVVRPVYAFTINTWTRGAQIGAVVFDTGNYMLVASGLPPLPNGHQYELGISTGPLPPSNMILGIDSLNVNSQGRTLAFGQLHGWTVATIDQQIVNGGVFVIHV
jgi:hypothetical protein